MSLSAQAKVLRALEESKVSRVGNDKDIKVDVRVVAATNKNLKKEIEDNNFREDLYHRLAVILIDVPKLEERTEDIPELVRYFAQKISKDQGMMEKEFSKNAFSTLQKFEWPGNIRELRNVVERLIILGGKKIGVQDIKEFSGK